MKINVVESDSINLILIPETEKDLMTLRDIAKSSVSLLLTEKTQILDKVIPNALIITVTNGQ